MYSKAYVNLLADIAHYPMGKLWGWFSDYILYPLVRAIVTQFDLSPRWQNTPPTVYFRSDYGPCPLMEKLEINPPLHIELPKGDA